MDFQGQGTTITGETEALALIDPISRYVVVIPFKNREAGRHMAPTSPNLIALCSLSERQTSSIQTLPLRSFFLKPLNFWLRQPTSPQPLLLCTMPGVTER
jgi:hypothetical protein